MRFSICRVLRVPALVVSVLGLAWSAQAGQLEKIHAAGEITIAHRNASIPFSYLDADGKPIGYAMDVCIKLADAIRRELKMPALPIKHLLVTSDTRIPAIRDGSATLECGSTTNNAERRKQVAFTIPHFIAASRLLVRSNSGIDSLQKLAGKSVASTKATSPLARLKALNADQSLHLKIVEAPDHAQAMALLADGNAAAFAMDDVLLAGLRANQPRPGDFALVGKPMTIEPYAIMLPRDAALKKVVDDEMRRIIQSGEINTLYAKWFQAPIAPRGINLGLPMPYMLRDAFKYPSDRVGDLD